MKKIIFFNLIVISLILISFELFLRIFNIIELQGFEKNTFYSENKIIYQNPNILKTGMGKKIKTDSNGFRIPLEKYEIIKDFPGVLILGDSVSFGVSVEERKTFIGLLRKKVKKNFYNTSVAGHRLEVYPILLEKYHRQFPEIEEILIFLCLNDIVVSDGIVKENDVGKNDTNYNSYKFLKTNLLVKINFFLREKSAIFNLAKAIGTQNVKRHFYYMYPYYKNRIYLETYEKNLEKLIKFSNLNKLDTKFVLLPYKHQTNNNCSSELMLPQSQIKNLFKKLNYQLFDFSEEFCNKNNNSKLFLNFDPMHLSSDGHKFVSELLIKRGIVN